MACSVITLLATGCMSPCLNCNNCDGYSHGGAGLPIGQRLGYNAACGDGCGEVYTGEWRNYPPACDPCETRRAGMAPAWRSFLGLRCDDYETCYGYDNVGADGCFEDRYRPACCAEIGGTSCGVSGCSDCGSGVVTQGMVPHQHSSGCTSCQNHTAGNQVINAGEVVVRGQPQSQRLRPVPSPAPQQPFQQTRNAQLKGRNILK